MNSFIERNGGRRFILVVSSVITFTLLLIFHYIDQATYMALTLPTLGGYLVANGVQKMTSKKVEE
jgi:hypothetical protein